MMNSDMGILDLNLSHSETIADLERLADSELLPVIQRLRFQLAKKKRQELASLDCLRKQEQETLRHLTQVFADQIKSSSQLRSIQISVDPQIKYSKWLGWVGELDQILNLSKIFNFIGHSHLSIRDDALSFRIDRIDLKLREKNAEESSLSITKDFLRREILFTSRQVNRKDGSSYLELNLKKGSMNQYFLNCMKSSFLLWPGVVSEFSISFDKFENLAQHLIFKVENNGQVKKLYSPKMVSNKGQELECDILHFSFLFRPLSLIIPNRGFVISDPSFGLFDTGSERQMMKKQEVFFSQLQENCFVDFFKLLSHQTKTKTKTVDYHFKRIV